MFSTWEQGFEIMLTHMHKMFVKMLTHIHMVMYTWWCWHIYKGDEVGVDMDQLGNGMEARKVRTPPVECPTVPLAPYIEKIGSHRVDRTLVTW